MGFAREARRVRDTSLPHARRVRALANCMVFSRPIGYHATWSYLEAKVGMARDNPGFLEPALDLLETQRAWYMEAASRYGALRLRLKRTGLRSPAADEVTPLSPRRWHGDERVGARHALVAWLQWRRDAELAADPDGGVAVSAAENVVLAPESPRVNVDELQRCLDWARRQINVVGWKADPRRYRVAWMAQFLLGQIHVSLYGQPAIGSAWNFVPDLGAQSGGRSAPGQRLKGPVGLWRLSPKEGTVELIDAATDLLVLGYDNPALRRLAGMSADDSQYEVGPVVEAVLDQFGAEHLLDGAPERAGLEVRLERFLTGDLHLRELSRWAHSTIGHGGEPDCEPFVILDDIYDDWEYAGHDLEFLTQTARRAANDFLAGRTVTRLDSLTPPTVDSNNDDGRGGRVKRWRDRIRLTKGEPDR